MSKKHYNSYDEVICWNELEDALKAIVTYQCPKCSSEISIQLGKSGEGAQFSTSEKALQKHLSTLQEKYHATARSINTECANGHAIIAVFIFGETQPMRYVLVKAACIKPQLTLKEKAVVLFTFTIITVSLSGYTAFTYILYKSQEQLDTFGLSYPAEILQLEASSLPKTPLSYRLTYRYYIGDISYDNEVQVDENTYNRLAGETIVDVAVDPSESAHSALKGNTSPRSAFVFSILLDCFFVAILLLSVYISRRRRQKRTSTSN
jgi:hypothetical protein